MEKIGETAAAGAGYTLAELDAIRVACAAMTCEVHDLHGAEGLPAGVAEARVLVIKGGVNHFFGAGYSKSMLEEQCGLDPDKKALTCPS